LGCSIGGELLNPGAPELLTISTATSVPTTAMLGDILRLVIPSLIVATLVFWAMDLCASFRNKTTSKDVVQELTSSGKETQSLNLFKATVPLVPLVLLFVASAPLNWVAIHSEWLLSSAVKSSATKPDTLYSTRLIGLAMLVGVGVAILASPGRILKVMTTFFEGAGYGFTHIISLIVTATCFGKGIEEVGLARNLGDLIAHSAGLLQPLAAFVPAGFAFISGSGMASTQSLYGFFHGPALSLGQDPIAIGAMVSVGSAAGRTMSPVSAVTLMSAELTGTRPFDLVWRVMPSLVIGLLVTVVLRMLRLI
jgi:DcuC family C4-dicarboxylate transporter